MTKRRRRRRRRRGGGVEGPEEPQAPPSFSEPRVRAAGQLPEGFGTPINNIGVVDKSVLHGPAPRRAKELGRIKQAEALGDYTRVEPGVIRALPHVANNDEFCAPMDMSEMI